MFAEKQPAEETQLKFSIPEQWASKPQYVTVLFASSLTAARSRDVFGVLHLFVCDLPSRLPLRFSLLFILRYDGPVDDAWFLSRLLCGGEKGKRKENWRCFLFEFGDAFKENKCLECLWIGTSAFIFRRRHSNQIASAFRVHPFNGLSCFEHEWIAPQSLPQSRKIIFNPSKENNIPTKLLSQSTLSILSKSIAQLNSSAFQWDF